GPGGMSAELVSVWRRRLEVFRTISVHAGADRPHSVLEGLRHVEGLGEVTQAGNRITARSSLGVPVTVTVSEDLAAHAMLAGSASEEHLAALAARAARMKVPWNLTGEHGGIAPKADSEEALYAALGLPYIEPELREGLGEIEAAEAGRLKPLVDAAMDYPDDVLASFDFVIASVHSRFNLSEEDQTRRICLALANPYVTMLGHATGRLLLSREGYRVDMRKVIETAAAHGKIVEINANPHRLDLDWRLCRYAKARGVRVSINPDAHATEGLEDVPFGVNVARKGGLEPSDVINTLGLKEILSALKLK